MARRKIQNIDLNFHCSIIGTCLSLEEARQLVDSSYNEDLSHLSDYEIHSIVVQGARGFSRFANRLNEKLNIKHRASIYISDQISSHLELEKFWKQSCIKGSIAGPYLAVVSHPSCTTESRNSAFGEVHMLSHLTGAGERQKLMEGENQKKKIIQLEADLIDCKKHLSNIQVKYGNKKKELAKIVRKNKALNSELTVLLEKKKQDSANNKDCLLKEVQKLQRRLSLMEDRNDFLQKNFDTMSDELESSREYGRFRLALAQKSSISEELCSRENCQNVTTLTGLKSQKVLLVGGRASMVPHCKSIVETFGGKFLSHDGGKEQSKSLLKEMAGSADIIICALDCVSHDASRCVKRICHGAEQKVIMLKNSGLSSFAKILERAV